MKLHFAFIAFLVFLFFSCIKKKEQPAFYDSGNTESVNETDTSLDTTTESSQFSDNQDVVIVPFKEQSGVKFVKVSVNGFGFEMIFDTGCSGTLISIAEAKYLYDKGYLTAEDYIGQSQSQIADGSIVENMKFNIKEIVIDNKIRCPNVIATVSSNVNAPLLLGNEVLNRVASYTIDNQNHTINFNLK